ncbi:MAG: carbonic anhydrase [Gammaproteobacteria bacterium]|nr:carbonic anhydrase [Gammaproteobacteria bacterium]
MRKHLLTVALSLSMLLPLYSNAAPATTSRDLTPAQVLAILKQGNANFVAHKLTKRDYQAEMQQTANAQNPDALILNCMDSRAIPAFVFDQGVGGIFVISVAGNVVNNDILGSMEYATKAVGTELIVVMGHTDCGAIKGVCNDVQLGHLTGLLEQIKPALDAAKKDMPNGVCTNPAYINDIAKQNVLLSIAQIKAGSPVIASLVKQGKVEIVGAMYDVATGKVTFL